jgi:Xaa-Pro dipeptidase
METMQPTLKNGRNVWDQVNMPKVEFENRITKIRKGMERDGMDVLLLYGNANEYGYPCYLSNYYNGLSTRGAMVALTKGGDIALIFEGPSRDLPMTKRTTWIEDIRPCGDIAKESASYLREKNLIPSTVGVSGLRQYMPHYQWQFLSEALNRCNIADTDLLLRDMRMTKSERECDQMRRSSRILARTLDMIPDVSCRELDEKMLEAMIHRETRLEGSEDSRILIAKPKESNWAFRPPGETHIKSGDTVIVYLALQLERYWAEGIRTFVATDFSLANMTIEQIGGVYKQAMDGLRPRKKVSRFYKETVRKIGKGNFSDVQKYGMGQGIGLSLHEFPWITSDEQTSLKEGMCLTLRLGLQDHMRGTFMLGNTLLLSKDGPEVLT